MSYSRMRGFASVNCELQWANRCIGIRCIAYIFITMQVKFFTTGDWIELSSSGLNCFGSFNVYQKLRAYFRSASRRSDMTCP